MNSKEKQLSSPYSSGSGGANFETHVQATFVVLMLTGGFVPCLPPGHIVKIKLQGKFANYQTDDLIVFVQDSREDGQSKLLGQIKHSINITENDSTFCDVIQSAWHDFKNTEMFVQGKDVLALITGPLRATDINDTRFILDWTRHSENSSEFFQKVELANFSSDAKRKKLKAFKTNLNKANNDNEVSNDEVFEFLKHFHLLGYDMDIKAGVTIALLYSLIGQYSASDTHSIWTSIVDEVQWSNQNAGTITIDGIQKNLLSIFRHRRVEVIPEKLAIPKIPKFPKTLDSESKISALTTAILLGKWNENNEYDLEIISNITDDYNKWITSLREILQDQDSPLVLRNGKWEIKDRKLIWDALSSRIFDTHLDKFKNCAIKVLSEIDPQFELPAGERYAANVYGKVLKYSTELRHGIAETLALLGNHGNILKNCSQHKARNTSSYIIREIFKKGSWELWGSLNYLLPLVAEAEPIEFLNLVEQAFQQIPCPFDDLFAQESSGFGGRNYLSGFLWALEGLSWNDEYLVRVILILAELASLDPGGNWANRPANSIVTILLPWFPQTLAPVNKRITSMKTIISEFPAVAWNVLLRLLPNQSQTTSGAYKPRWRNPLSEEWKPKVNNKEYLEQVAAYAELAVEMACQDLDRLREIVSNLDNLPEPSFNRVLDYLSSETITKLPEPKRLPIWSSLMEFVRKHRRFSDAEWALESDIVAKIENTANNLKPISAEGLYKELFSFNDWDLYEENGDWEKQQKELDERRQHAIQEILNANGLEEVLDFIEQVESPYHVGWALGRIPDKSIDRNLLPNYLDSKKSKYKQFTGSFVSSRQKCQGWKWVDDLNRTDWTPTQKCQLLVNLPFEFETWERARRWLKKQENLYWKNVTINPFQSKSDLIFAIDKLLETSRPQAAIECLYSRLHKKLPLDKERTVKALLDVATNIESAKAINYHYTSELIKALQNDSTTIHEDLFRVEWAYMPLMENYRNVKPKFLGTKLATEPEFFCEIIRLIYRSKTEQKKVEEPGEKRKALANNAWQLLYEWKMPPGLMNDGKFSIKDFETWLKSVKGKCKSSGHFEIAMVKVGEVLIYCPPDPDGLWIIRSVAMALNARDAEDMRQGFYTAIYNSRGVHTVDPTGTPEREIADKWRQRAEDAENAGFARFAVKLRELADSYDRQADRIIEEHKSFK